jgi:hypothetical protein
VPEKKAALNRMDGSFVKALHDVLDGPLSNLLEFGASVTGTLTLHDDMDREHTVNVRYDNDDGPYIVL